MTDEHMENEVDLVIGVLALQGDVADHRRILGECQVATRAVRRVSDLDGVDGLVIPGGESTVMIRLLRRFDLLAPLRDRIAAGLPVYGSCAGMILLADRIIDGEPGQEGVGGMDMTVRRNAFGRQVASFETDIDIVGITDAGEELAHPIRAVFIRAPWVESSGESVEVLSRVDLPDGSSAVVAVRHGDLLATAFHPEVTDDTRVHAFFADMVRAAVHRGGARRVAAKTLD